MSTQAPNNLTKKEVSLYSAVTLLMGEWRTHFDEHQYKRIVARALNICVEEHKIAINAYIISSHKICLVLYTRYHSLEKSLDYFNKKLREEMLRHFDWTELKKEHHHKTSFIELFIQLPSSNYELVQLIAGRPVELPYYSTHLEKLKKYVYQHSFCSAANYDKRTGPVEIQRLKNKHIYINLYNWEMEEI